MYIIFFNPETWQLRQYYGCTLNLFTLLICHCIEIFKYKQLLDFFIDAIPQYILIKISTNTVIFVFPLCSGVALFFAPIL